LFDCAKDLLIEAMAREDAMAAFANNWRAVERSGRSPDCLKMQNPNAPP